MIKHMSVSHIGFSSRYSFVAKLYHEGISFYFVSSRKLCLENVEDLKEIREDKLSQDKISSK